MRGVKMTADGIRLVGPTADPRRATSGSPWSVPGSAAPTSTWRPWDRRGRSSATSSRAGSTTARPSPCCRWCTAVPATGAWPARTPSAAPRSAPCTGSASTAAWPTRRGSDPACAVPLPADLSPEHANLVEPLGVALHGLHRSGVVEGMRVLVLGAGPVGLCTVAAARHLGADVDIEAHRPTRLAAAERLGASVASGADYDVVLDAAGTQSSLDRATELVRPGGTVGVLGTFWDPVALGMAFQMKEVHPRARLHLRPPPRGRASSPRRPGSWTPSPTWPTPWSPTGSASTTPPRRSGWPATATRTRSRSSSTPDGGRRGRLRHHRLSPAGAVRT